jgi:glutamate synthase domain-containing protein 3
VVEGVGDHACEYMTGGRIAILGKTGKNFAAGMSGGIAYVYDPQEEFPPLCNPEMVDLDPLEDEDISTLRAMIEDHMAYTRSSVASSILKNWDHEISHFVKVIPFDYKKVLEQHKESEKMKIAV